MKKLVSCLAFAMLIAFVTEAKAAPADNGPPAFVAPAELVLQATNQTYVCDATQYAIAVSENPNSLAVTAVVDDEVLTTGAIDNDVGWDLCTMEIYAGRTRDEGRQRDTGVQRVGALRAQAT